MNQMLQNEAVQAALITLIVIGLNALAAWVKSKVSNTAIVNEWWCYIQPVAEAVRQEALKELAASKLSTTAWGQLIQKGVAAFADQYRANEGKEPTATQLSAVSRELDDVIGRVLGG
jgi:hypothetical protein